MNYTYRNILASDYEAIERYEDERVAIDSISVECLDEMFQFGENNFATYHGLIAEHDGELVGYVIYFELTQHPGKKCIIRCFVDPEHRREGVGSQLIQRCEPTQSGHRVSIEVGLDDYAEASFLRKNGYTVIEIIDAEYNEEGEIEMDGFMILVNEKKKVMELAQRLAWRAN